MRAAHRRLRFVAVASGIALLAALATPPAPALASAVYTVTSPADAPDASVGNGSCATSTGTCTVRAAIQEANASTAADTVVVPAGTYTLTLAPQGDNLIASGDLDITRPLTVQGAGKEATIIDGGPGQVGLDRVLEIHPTAGNVTIQNLTMREGNEAEQGGGVHTTSEGTVRFENVAVRNSQAGTFGAGISSQGAGRLDLVGVDLVDNTTEVGEGGGLYVAFGTVNFQGTIEGNTAATGGGIFNSGEPSPEGIPAVVKVANTTIADNTAIAAGGGAYVDHEGELTLTDTTVVNNQAVEDGGGVAAISKTAVTVTRGKFESNKAGGEGGGLSTSTERPVNVQGTTFKDNEAGDPVSGDGGGAGMSAGGDGAVTIANATFDGNESIAGGGGLHTGNNGSVTVKDSKFTNNTTSAEGGGFANTGDRTTLERLTFEGNKATLDGGGIANEGSGAFSLVDSSVHGNTAENGGGMANLADGELRVIRSTFWNNQARLGASDDSGLGGGVYGLGDAEATYENVTISANYAQTRGGGLYIDSDSTVDVVNSTISQNTAPTASGVGGEVTSINFPITPSTSVLFRNTIVAGNRLGADCNFAVGSVGGNLDSADTCFFRGPRDRQHAGDPRIDAVADNGRSTLTQAIRQDSYAIDGGLAPCPTTDQRGVERPKGAACDIGAYEHEGPFAAPDTTPPNTSLVDPPATTGETATFRFNGTDNVTEPADLLYECRILTNDPTDPPDPPDPTEPPDPDEMFLGCPNPYEAMAIEEGDNRIEVRAIDRAGNVDQSPAVHNFVGGLDVTPPQTSFPLTPPDPSNGRTATFGFTATDDLTPLILLEFECRIDSVDPEAWLECYSPTTFSNLTPGEHTVEVRATDESDNVDPTPARFEWTVASPANCDEANVTIPASQDAYVDEVNPEENLGAEPELTVRSQATGGDARSLVKFTLPTTLPAGCELESASLRLHADGGEAGRTLSAAPIVADWNEATVTWNNQPATVGTEAMATSGPGTRSWNLTSQVAAMLAGGPNNGFLVKDTQEEGEPGAEQVFASSEAEQDPGTPPTYPRLVLRFDGPGTPPPPAPADPVPTTVACGQILTQSTLVLNDLTDCPLDGLVIGAPNIKLDLNGKTIDGPGYFEGQPGSPIELPEEGLPAGVRNVGHTGVVIVNGTVQEFGYGVQLMAGSRYGTVQDLTVRGNATAGIELSDADDGRNGNQVRENVLEDNEIGISLLNDTENSVIADNQLRGSFASGIHVWSGSGNTLENNRVSGVTSDPLLDSDGGIRIEASTENVLVDNVVIDTGDAGVMITDGAHGNEVRGGTYTRTGDAGVVIEDSDANQVIGISAHLASDSGIGMNGANDSVIRENDVRFNPSGIELEGGSRNLIEDNDASRSSGTGISVSGESLRNRILGNTVIAAEGDGIAVLNEALDLDGNPLDGNVIQGNLANSSLSDGISAAAGHTVTSNIAHNNAAWGINAAEPVIDGGGNVANGNGEPEQCAGVVCGDGIPAPPVLPDLEAPNTTLTQNPTNPSSSLGTAVFDFTGTDNVAPPGALRFECRLDAPPDPPDPDPDPTEPYPGENWLECANPLTYRFLPAGEHKFEVRAVDPSDNFDPSPATYTWTVVPAPPGPDSVPPSTTIFQRPDASTSSTEAVFGFRGSDNQTPGPNLRYECRLDAAPFAACLSPKTYPGLAVGEHTFQVRAIDLADNVDPTPASSTWTIVAPPADTTPPDTTIVSGPDPSTVATTATFTFTATEAGSTFACALDTGAYASCSSPHQLTGLSTGAHTFRVRATDGAGNVDLSPAEYTWTVAAAPVPTTVTCGQVLTQSTRVTNDLTDCQNDGLVIGANGITLDLGGSVIDGIGQGVGIRNDGFDAVTIRNGTVQEFDYGVQLGANTALGIVADLTLRLHQEAGAYLNNADDGTNGNQVRDNSFAGNAAGIVLENGTQGALVQRNTVAGSAREGIRVLSSTGNRFEENSITGSSESGIMLDLASGNNSLVGNTITASAKSAVLIQAASHGNLVEGNTVSEGEAGIEVIDSNETQIIANVANSFDKPGVVLERAHDTVVRGNDLRFNGGGIELLESNRNRLESNDASENADTGIAIGSLSLGNVILSNLTSANESEGIAVEAEVLPESTDPGNVIERNIANDNTSDGIAVNKAGHRITANTANNNDGWGIYAEINNTDGGGNRAVGNTELLQCFNIECNGGPPIPPEVNPPDTEILEMPANPSASHSASFIFTGTDDNTPLFELEFECRLDGATFADCENPQLYSNLSPGVHTFQVRAMDLAEKVDPTPATYTWTVELPAPGVPPDTTITSGPPAQSPFEEAVFLFTSNEPDATFECSLDGASYTSCVSPLEFEEITFGAHELRVRAVDDEGNRDPSPAVHPWTRVGPPVVTITAGPEDPTTSTTASFTFGANEPVTGFACSLDLAPFVECASPATFSDLAVGSHVLRIQATDLDEIPSGEDEMGLWEWEIEPSLDTTPPVTVLLTQPANPSGDATFTFTGTDNVTSPDGLLFECRLDSDNEADFAECTSPWTYPNPEVPEPLTNGPHTFDVRAVDAEDNVDASPVRYAWTYSGDVVEPQTTIATGPPATTGLIDVTFTFTADDPFATFECSVDGAAYEECSSPYQVQGMEPGAHELRVRALDLSGNVESSPAVRTWTVVVPDATPPVTVLGSAPPASTASTTATFTFSANEPGSTFRCALDGSAAVTCGSPRNLTGLAVGGHTFAVHAVDAAGNPDASPAVHTWTVTPPVPTCTPGSVTVGAAADSWVLQDSPNQNYGTDSVLKVDSKSGANARALVRFNLPTIPAACQVTDAKLRLYASSYKSGRTLQAHGLAASWTESAVRWSNQPPLAGTPVTAPSATSARYVEWDVDQLLSTHGFLIKDAVENGGGLDQGFHSREKGTDNPPRLVVSYG